jgi:superfamily II DNA/RNA helicase
MYKNKYHMPNNRSNNNRSNSFKSRRPSRGPKKDYINPARFIKSAVVKEPEEAYVPKHRFADFPVDKRLAQKIEQRGFDSPSPIQDQIIPHGLQGRDVIGIANTGTGKTMAFAIPVLNHLMTNPRAKALIVAPTRELADQILQECKTLLANSGLYWALLIGGAPMGIQLRDLKRRPNLVIGTPGRIKDHLERGSLVLTTFTMVVLDEVDRMLDMGFIDDMRDILECIPPTNRQSYFFSATIDQRVRNLIGEYSNDAVSISVVTGDTSDSVEQDVVHYSHQNDKVTKLHDILISDKNNKVLIFDETRRDVDKLSRSLRDLGFKADLIHGGKTQGQRKRALENFKQNKINIMVATDVAARGIDVDGVTHVINYSTPQSYNDYVHRIGRAGRAGRAGYAFTFIEKR